MYPFPPEMVEYGYYPQEFPEYPVPMPMMGYPMPPAAYPRYPAPMQPYPSYGSIFSFLFFSFLFFSFLFFSFLFFSFLYLFFSSSLPKLNPTLFVLDPYPPPPYPKDSFRPNTFK